MSDIRSSYGLYILSEDGMPVNNMVVDTITENLLDTIDIEEVGTGSDYNVPVYLLEKISDYTDSSIVVAMDWDYGIKAHPRFFVTEADIIKLVIALENNLDADAWEIAVEVNESITGC